MTCRRYRRLRRLAEEAPVADSLARRMRAHEDSCAACRSAYEDEKEAIAAFVQCTVQTPEAPPSGYEARLAAKARAQASVRTWRFWAPAMMGAALAGVAALALVQLLATKPVEHRPSLDGSEARRIELPLIPSGAATNR